MSYPPPYTVRMKIIIYDQKHSTPRVSLTPCFSKVWQLLQSPNGFNRFLPLVSPPQRSWRRRITSPSVSFVPSFPCSCAGPPHPTLDPVLLDSTIQRFNAFEVAPKQWTRAVTFEASLMKHLKSRKHHSKAFRKDAVELLLTGRTLDDLSTELGVSATTLYRWKEEYLMELSQQPADTALLPPLKMQEELQRLRKENQKLKLHQEILKKAMGILSDLPPNGMP